MSVKNEKEQEKQKPDTTGHIPTTVVCDQCGHPKKAHRQDKYYCEADLIQDDPINNNAKIKVMCSCTRYENAEEEKQNKEQEQKEPNPGKHDKFPPGQERKPAGFVSKIENLGPINPGDGEVLIG